MIRDWRLEISGMVVSLNGGVIGGLAGAIIGALFNIPGVFMVRSSRKLIDDEEIAAIRASAVQPAEV